MGQLFRLNKIGQLFLQVLKTGQGVMEYMRLGGKMSQEAVVDIGKNVLHISEKKINALLAMQQI